MRRRIAAAIGGVAVLALLLYAGPRTLVVVDLVRDQERGATDRSADLIAQALDRRVREGRPTEARVFRTSLRDGERLVVEREGRTDVAGDTGGPPSYRAERPLATGGTVTIELGDAVVDERIAEALDSIVVAVVVVVVLALAVAVVLSRRIVRPFVALADYAEALRHDLGTDTADAPTPPGATGIAEADALATTLARTDGKVRELLGRERQFSANASHQLRTPLTALRLRLEDVALWPEVPDAVRDELEAALREVDRLDATATDLLELARSGGIGGWQEVAVDVVVAEVVDRWHAAYAAADRRVAHHGAGASATVPTSERSLRQILDVLLDNALVHGRGAVDVTVRVRDDHVAVCASDEGASPVDQARRAFERTARSPATGGSGIGLSLAQTVAEATGARLALVSRDPTTFEVRIPRPATGGRRAPS